jgi:hypothetical protein
LDFLQPYLAAWVVEVSVASVVMVVAVVLAEVVVLVVAVLVGEGEAVLVAVVLRGVGNG